MNKCLSQFLFYLLIGLSSIEFVSIVMYIAIMVLTKMAKPVPEDEYAKYIPSFIMGIIQVILCSISISIIIFLGILALYMQDNRRLKWFCIR